jgi:hypothetical protein
MRDAPSGGREGQELVLLGVHLVAPHVPVVVGDGVMPRLPVMVVVVAVVCSVLGLYVFFGGGGVDPWFMYFAFARCVR